MTTIPPAGALASRLADLSSIARGPARITAQADYLHPIDETSGRRIMRGATNVLKGIEGAKREHEAFLNSPAGYETHFELNGATRDIEDGIATLRARVAIEDDVLRNGDMVEDDVPVGGGDTIIREGSAAATASAHFDSASRRLAFAADGLSIQTMSDAELMAKLLGPLD